MSRPPHQPCRCRIAGAAAPLHVTGMSWSTPLGEDLDAVWRQLLEGRDGFTERPSALPLRNRLAGAVTRVPETLGHGERMLALGAGRLRAAFDDAGLDPAQPGIALVLGTSFGAHLDEQTKSLYDWCSQLAAAVGFAGEPICVATACSAAADAVMAGAHLVRSGAYRAAVCGGVDILTPAKRLAHSLLQTMTDERLHAFDVRHSGMLLGEGAGFLVLEPGTARAGRSYAVLRGAGSSNDAAGTTTPAPDGRTVHAAVERALHRSGLSVADIAAVSAHGTGTVVGDEAEARGIALAFGTLPETRRPAVFATKGALGHALGACGAIEAITLILALRDRRTPPIAALRTPIPQAAGFVHSGPGDVRGQAGVSLTLGFGGFNTALAFSTPPGERDGEAVVRNSDGDAGGVGVLSTAQVSSSRPEEYGRNSASKYLDPVAWLCAEAARRALAGAPQALESRQQTAVLAVSEHGTLGTMQSVARRISTGRLSPLHFVGANPGLLAGATCMQWGLQGPSMTLTTPPALAAHTAHTVAHGWLELGQARHVLLITHDLAGETHTASCSVLGRAA